QLPRSQEEQRSIPRSSIQVLASFFFSSSLPTFANSQYLLRQPHRLGQSIVPNEQIHLDPIASALFVNRQAQCAQRAPLHVYAQNRGVIGIRGERSRQKCEAAQLVVRHKSFRLGNFRRTPLRRSIGNLSRSHRSLMI